MRCGSCRISSVEDLMQSSGTSPSSSCIDSTTSPFTPPHGETIEELEGLKEAEIAGKSALRQLQRTDQVIIAAALAQIKITGQLHPSLYRLALLAIERLGRIAVARAGTLVTMTSETLASIARDLKRYWAEQR